MYAHMTDFRDANTEYEVFGIIAFDAYEKRQTLNLVKKRLKGI